MIVGVYISGALWSDLGCHLAAVKVKFSDVTRTIYVQVCVLVTTTTTWK